jgi:hypothetical protein
MEDVDSQSFSNGYTDGMTAGEWLCWAKALQWLYGEGDDE